MNCQEAIRLMDAYLDGELDPITSQEIEKHLRDCRNCEQAYRTHRSLIRAVSNATSYYKAPGGLRERIQSSLREEIGERPAPDAVREAQLLVSKSKPEPRALLWEVPWNWLGLAAAIILAAIIALNLVPRFYQNGAGQFLATQLIASHARSLMANHLTDVPSSDQHTVKPWLDARLDFAPPVADLSSDGFPLIGGRLDYLDNRPVAALIYQRRKHFINLFVWPAEAHPSGATKTMSRQGYHLLHWVDSDFNYWAVSDVNADDLQTFKQKFGDQTSRH